ncbi:Arylsulfatase [Geodia barretti]|uniref:Arylsulfatase n=1 Tax=Geodia barretti TaxID=519541 RepID=A0AA35S8Z9_GEOBA|nr:Arylsulfatase [Geodia barretti]
MRGDCIGADGNTCIETPNLDYLAARGTRFRHAYTASPSCIPARATLMTGMNQWHTGILGMGRGQGPIPNDFPHTLAGELTHVGYRTHLVGKGHFTPQRAKMGFESQEFDESGRMLRHGLKDEYRTWFEAEKRRDITPDDHGVDWNSWVSRPWHTEEYLHPTSWTMNSAIHFLSQRDRERPFFLNISFARPHSPFVPPAPYFEMYHNGTTPPPSVGDWATCHDRPEVAVDPNAWRGKHSDRRIHRARSGYYGEISFIDTQIGRLMNWFRRHQQDTFADTWFIFTSDHGEMLGDHNLWRKTYAYEGSARIPFIVTPPTRGSTASRKVADEEMQYVTDGKRKLIWLPRIDELQFFNLEEDPGECHNRINHPEYQTEVAKWKGYLIAELATRDCGWVVDGELVSPPPETPLVSPYKNVRWEGEA